MPAQVLGSLSLAPTKERIPEKNGPRFGIVKVIELSLYDFKADFSEFARKRCDNRGYCLFGNATLPKRNLFDKVVKSLCKRGFNFGL